MTKRAKEILDFYRSENACVLSNIARVINHVRLAGTGIREEDVLGVDGRGPAERVAPSGQPAHPERLTDQLAQIGGVHQEGGERHVGGIDAVPQQPARACGFGEQPKAAEDPAQPHARDPAFVHDCTPRLSQRKSPPPTSPSQAPDYGSSSFNIEV